MASASGSWNANNASSVAVPADAHREGLIVQNYSDSAASVFVGIGRAATADQGQELVPGAVMKLRGRMAQKRVETVTAAGVAAGGYQGF